MQYTDEQIQNMVQLKETIIEKLGKYEEEIAFLQKTLDILDTSLKDSSFTKASKLPKTNSDKKINSEVLEKTDNLKETLCDVYAELDAMHQEKETIYFR